MSAAGARTMQHIGAGWTRQDRSRQQDDGRIDRSPHSLLHQLWVHPSRSVVNSPTRPTSKVCSFNSGVCLWPDTGTEYFLDKIVSTVPGPEQTVTVNSRL